MSLETLAKDYGSKHEFTTKIKYFYSDNSMAKSLRNKKASKEVVASVIKSNSRILGQLQISKYLEQEKLQHKRLKNRYRLYSNQVREVTRYAEKAATVIQKHVRGWLFRSNVHELKCRHAQNVISHQLHDMKKQIYSQWLRTDELKSAVLRIEKSYIKRLFLKKIERIQHTYNVLRSKNLEHAYSVLRVFIVKSIWYQRLKETKLELYKFKRLEQLKKKMMAYRITGFLKKRNLTIAKITLMYKRARRAAARARKSWNQKNSSKYQQKKKLDRKPSEDIPGQSSLDLNSQMSRSPIDSSPFFENLDIEPSFVFTPMIPPSGDLNTPEKQSIERTYLIRESPVRDLKNISRTNSIIEEPFVGEKDEISESKIEDKGLMDKETPVRNEISPTMLIQSTPSPIEETPVGVKSTTPILRIEDRSPIVSASKIYEESSPVKIVENSSRKDLKCVEESEYDDFEKKMALMKNSYNLKSPQEKTITRVPKDRFSHSSATEASLSRWSAADRSRTRDRSRYLFAGNAPSYIISSFRRKRRTDRTGSYMKNTESSLRRGSAVEDAKRNSTFVPLPDERLFKNTQSFFNKRREKLKDYMEPLWSYNVRPKEEYVKSLNNINNTPRIQYPRYRSVIPEEMSSTNKPARIVVKSIRYLDQRPPEEGVQNIRSLSQVSSL